MRPQCPNCHQAYLRKDKKSNDIVCPICGYRLQDF